MSQGGCHGNIPHSMEYVVWKLWLNAVSSRKEQDTYKIHIIQEQNIVRLGHGYDFFVREVQPP